MRTRRTKHTVVAAIIATMVATILPIATLAQPASAQAGDEQYFVNQINALRASVGVAPLAVDPDMAALAAAHTGEMMGAGQLYHAPKLSIGVSGGWAKLGENVGRGSYAELVWNAFVNSPAHYANLVDPMYTHVGISVMYDGGGQLWTTQRFVARTGGGVDGDTGGGASADPEPRPRGGPPDRAPGQRAGAGARARGAPCAAAATGRSGLESARCSTSFTPAQIDPRAQPRLVLRR